MATISNFSTGFNPVSFMYLNPELCLDQNISTVERARDFWNPSLSNLWTNLDFIPSAFDPAVFIGDQKDVINVSGLNESIRMSMSNEGYSDCELGRVSTFSIPTIYRNVYYTGLSNTLKFNNPGDSNVFSITANNLQVGDYVKLILGAATPLYTRVSAIVDWQTFKVEAPIRAGGILTGIRLYDPLRLARISFLRLFELDIEPNVLVNSVPTFNYELYSLLYPDARPLGKEAAFVDYVNRFGNNDVRIANVDEIGLGHASSLEQNIDQLTVHQLLNLDFGQETGRFQWNDVCMYYVTDDPRKPLESASPYFQGLITEYAIKKYIYNLTQPEFTICNIHVTGNALVDVCTTTCNLVVKNTSEFKGQVTGYNATFSNVLVNDALFSERVGIGPVETTNDYAYPLVQSSCNVQLDNLVIDETLYVTKTAQFMGDVLGNAAVFGSLVTGPRFGVGFDNSPWLDPLSNAGTIGSLLVTSNLSSPILCAGLANFDNMYIGQGTTTFNLTAANMFSSNLFINSNISCTGTINAIGDLIVGQRLVTANVTCDVITTSNLNMSNMTVDNVLWASNMYSYSHLASNITTKYMTISKNMTVSNLITTSNISVSGTIHCTGDIVSDNRVSSKGGCFFPEALGQVSVLRGIADISSNIYDIVFTQPYADPPLVFVTSYGECNAHAFITLKSGAGARIQVEYWPCQVMWMAIGL